MLAEARHHSEAPVLANRPGATAAAAGLTIVRPQNPVYALGLAVSYLMASPAFARQPFGHWSGVLAGQINRGHYLFAVEDRKVVGFVGWSLASKRVAEDWLAGRAAPASDESRSGEIMLINAWQADSREAKRLLLQAIRRVGRDCSAVYAKRYRADGSFRPMRLAVNGFVPDHIAPDALTFSFTSLNA